MDTPKTPDLLKDVEVGKRLLREWREGLLEEVKGLRKEGTKWEVRWRVVKNMKRTTGLKGVRSRSAYRTRIRCWARMWLEKRRLAEALEKAATSLEGVALEDGARMLQHMAPGGAGTVLRIERGLALVLTVPVSLEDTNGEVHYLGRIGVVVDPQVWLGEVDGSVDFRRDPSVEKSSRGYFHPHVSGSGRACWGDAFDPLMWAADRKDAPELLRVVLAWLQTYGSDSPYQKLESWESGDSCAVCGEEVDDSYGCSNCGSLICEDCGHSCDDCGDWFCSGCLHSNGRCESCQALWDETHTECYHCGNAQLTEYMVCCEECGNWSCADCMEQCADCGDRVCPHCRWDGDEQDYLCVDCKGKREEIEEEKDEWRKEQLSLSLRSEGAVDVRQMTLWAEFYRVTTERIREGG